MKKQVTRVNEGRFSVSVGNGNLCRHTYLNGTEADAHQLADKWLNGLWIEDVQTNSQDDRTFILSLKLLADGHHADTLEDFYNLLVSVNTPESAYIIGHGGHHIWISRRAEEADRAAGPFHRVCIITKRGAEC